MNKEMEDRLVWESGDRTSLDAMLACTDEDLLSEHMNLHEMLVGCPHKGELSYREVFDAVDLEGKFVYLAKLCREVFGRPSTKRYKAARTAIADLARNEHLVVRSNPLGQMVGLSHFIPPFPGQPVVAPGDIIALVKKYPFALPRRTLAGMTGHISSAQRTIGALLRSNCLRETAVRRGGPNRALLISMAESEWDAAEQVLDAPLQGESLMRRVGEVLRALGPKDDSTTLEGFVAACGGIYGPFGLKRPSLMVWLERQIRLGNFKVSQKGHLRSSASSLPALLDSRLANYDLSDWRAAYSQVRKEKDGTVMPGARGAGELFQLHYVWGCIGRVGKLGPKAFKGWVEGIVWGLDRATVGEGMWGFGPKEAGSTASWDRWVEEGLIRKDAKGEVVTTGYSSQRAALGGALNRAFGTTMLYTQNESRLRYMFEWREAAKKALKSMPTPEEKAESEARCLATGLTEYQRQDAEREAVANIIKRKAETKAKRIS